jgi:hypothetical protein
MKKISITLLLLSTFITALPTLAVDHQWLLGKWELSYDPEGNEKDWVEFSEGAEVISITPDGRRIPGIYRVNDSEINISFSYKGLTIPIRYTYTPAKNQLLLFSEKTGNTSIYKKATK